MSFRPDFRINSLILSLRWSKSASQIGPGAVIANQLFPAFGSPTIAIFSLGSDSKSTSPLMFSYTIILLLHELLPHHNRFLLRAKLIDPTSLALETLPFHPCRNRCSCLR